MGDHLIYKHFIFKRKEHQVTLMKHAKELIKFFKKRNEKHEEYDKIYKDIKYNLAISN